MKRLAILVLASLLILVLAPRPSLAQNTISASYDTDVKFPDSLTFRLDAESGTDITQITLSYKVDKITTVTLINEAVPEFDAATEVVTSWEWDMRMASLPPGAEIHYNWKIEDAAGHELETAWQTVRFSDDRYQWKSVTAGKISLFWYQGERSFAEELLDTASDALEKLGQDTGAYLEQSAEIYIYASSEDLLGALIYPQEWTGGVAFTDYGILAIGIGPGDASWGKRAMTHELTHLVTYQMTFNPYNNIPSWLNEGLSMYAEGELEPTFTYYLDNAISADSLISVQSLSSSFPTDPDEARLSYAESYNLVEFLIENYGSEKMLSLLDTFQQGSTYDNALEKVYGFDTAGLDNLWRRSLGLGPRPSPTPTPQVTATPTPTPQTGFLECKEASATTKHGAVGLGALGILLLPGIGEVMRFKARRGKR